MSRKGLLAGPVLALALAAPAPAATIPVTSLLDNVDGADGVTTLREAIIVANGTVATDSITFSVTGTITTSAGALPVISQPATIEGPGEDGVPEVQVHSATTSVMEATATVTLRDVALTGSTSWAAILYGDDSVVERAWVGLNLAGTAVATGSGFLLAGDRTSIDDSAVGGVTGAGVSVAADDVLVTANKIGTDYDGTADRGNGSGVQVFSGSDRTRIQAGNVISGNTGAGVRVQSGSTATEVRNNSIGVGSGGVTLSNSNGIEVLAAVVVEGNVISGNTGAGILVDSTAGSSAVVVEDNSIGLNSSRDAAIPNDTGVVVGGASNVTIGGSTTSGNGNHISGNTTAGLLLGSASAPRIMGNVIGLDSNNVARSNGYGIDAVSASGALIGDGTADMRNVISGNATAGVRVRSGATATLNGNYIGTRTAGTDARPNGVGVLLAGSGSQVLGNGTGSTLISGNTGAGILVTGAGNTMSGNYIGLGAGGIERGNGTHGVWVQGASNTVGTGNVIGANGDYGVFLDNTGATGNIVRGNQIGVHGATDRGNGDDGILVRFGAAGNVIGGTAAGQGNEIAYSDNGKGIAVFDGSGNSIRGNLLHHLTGFGIDLFGQNAADPNDTGSGVEDDDTGGNDVQNYPSFLQARYLGDKLRVFGTLYTPSAGGTYGLDVFASSECHSTGFGPRNDATYLGSVDLVKSAGVRFLNLDPIMTTATPVAGKVITVTVTNPGDSTSEFSTCTGPDPGTVATTEAATKEVAEGAGSVTVQLTRTTAFGSPPGASVSVAAVGGSATAGSDFTVPATSVTFADNALTASVVVPIAADSAYEGNETFTVTLGDPFGVNFIGTPGTTTITIVDDDPAPVTPPTDTTGGTPGTTTPVGTTQLPSGNGAAAADPPVVSALTVRPKARRRAAVTFALSAAGRIRLTFARLVRGRMVGDRCVKETARNRRRPACERVVPVVGEVLRPATAGANAFIFGGRVGGKRLPGGRYRVIAQGVAADGRLSEAVEKVVRLRR